MTKKKLFFIFLLSMQYVFSSAQTSLGLEAGISSGFINTNISNRPSTVIDHNIGYTINIPFQYKIKDWLYFETGIDITQKNYFIDRTDSFAGLYTAFKNTYLQIPLMLKYVYGKRLQLFADAGVYGGYWVSSRIAGTTPNIFGIDSSNRIEDINYKQKNTLTSQIDNRLEFGWVVGVGVHYHLNKKYMFIADGKYYQSLTDQLKKYFINEVPQYNTAFTFSLGCMLSFK
jgi:hypothetical protein